MSFTRFFLFERLECVIFLSQRFGRNKRSKEQTGTLPGNRRVTSLKEKPSKNMTEQNGYELNVLFFVNKYTER